MTAARVLAVASECYPLVKTGGLADVVGALPAALANEGVAVRTLIPGYPQVMRGLPDGAAIIHAMAELFGGPARLLAADAGGIDLLVLDAPHLFRRPGNPYLAPDGRDWPDNAVRFAALSRVAADIGMGMLPDYRPDVVHAHDWQAGLTLAYLYFAPGRRRPGTVMTVHNLAFQGLFPAGLLPVIGLPPAAMSVDGIEYFGDLSFLKAGLVYADRITTVSPTYAAEIRTPEHGMGLDGLLRARAGVVSGILNGIDTAAWNPAADGWLAAPYGPDEMASRAVNKVALQAEMGLAAEAATPLFAVISRLSWQKGLDLLLAALPGLLDAGAQLAVLGSGEAELEAGFRIAAAEHPGRIGCVIGYDEALAHRLQGGADALLVPSRFEPCGLTQLCALRYGDVPVVARVGGLADTVIDANPMALAAGVATGLQFSPVTADALGDAIRRAVSLYRQPELWRRLQSNGMATDVSWRGSARSYADLFRALIATPA